MIRLLIVMCLLSITLPQYVNADDRLDAYFNKDKADRSIDDLFQESAKFQWLAHKIKDNPEYKKAKSISKDLVIDIKITGMDIKSFGDINTESLYLKPAHDRLYAKRYIEYMEYKTKKLELELAKAKGNETEILSKEVENFKNNLMKYFDDNEWPD